MSRPSKPPATTDAASFRKNFDYTLKQYTIADLPLSHRSVIAISAAESVTEAYHILLQHKIQSAPVVRQASPPAYIGFLDQRSLISSVVSVYDKKGPGADFGRLTESAGGPAVTPSDLHGWTLEYIARMYPFRSVKRADSLYEVCRILAMGQHRVGVLGDDGFAVRIISQSMMMEALEVAVKGLCGDVTIGELGVGPKMVYSCTTEQPFIDALRLMAQHNISGLPIVDPKKGKLQGHLTASSLRPVLFGQFHVRLDQGVKHFVSPSTTLGGKLTIKTTTKLRDVIKRFLETKSHRLFLVDGEGRLVGVCSLKNALAAMMGLSPDI